MVKIIVTAVPGAGKSTILKRVVEKIPSIKIVNFGDIMLEEASKRFGINDRDELRKKLNFKDYKILQEDAAKIIAGMEG
jgi:adenylate kinase